MGRLGAIGGPAGQGLVEDRAQGMNVGARADLSQPARTCSGAM